MTTQGQAQIDRVVREEREWLTVRLHHAKHGNWLPTDECLRCSPLPAPLPSGEAGATLTLSPWAHAALSLQDMTHLGERAVRLHCRISVGQGKSHEWTIRVSSWAKDDHNTPIHKLDRFGQVGNLGWLMQKALDEYERAFVFGPDELVAIAAQS